MSFRYWSLTAVGILNKIHRFLIPLENTVVFLLVFSEMILMFLQVVARFWGGGWLFIEELSRYLVLWIGIFGALIATRTRRHIAIEILPRMLNEKVRRILFFFEDLFVAGVVLILAVATWRYMDTLTGEKSHTLHMEVRTLLYPFFIGTILLILRFILVALGVYEEEPQLIRDKEDGSWGS